MHILLHADDMIVLSTDLNLFVKKCNIMLDYFSMNKLTLNLSKSGFTCIEGNTYDKKNVLLSNGLLKYKSQLKYLGVIISDSGSIKVDVKNFVIGKRGNVLSKFTNVCAKNYLAPLKIKLHILDACVTSSITYSCETWAGAIPKDAEVSYRTGIKTALSIRQNTNNEIVYI